MTAVIPVDDYVSDEWYPGFQQEMFDQPWAIEQTRPLRKEDESRFWFLDFHWPRGFTPMGAATWCEDGYCWGTQYAAETLPLPPGKGFVGRLAGTHLYGTAMPVTNPRELAARGKRLGRTLPGFLGNFAENWAVARDEVDEGWQYFRGLDLTPQSPAELAATLREARAYSRRAYEIHFEVMYPMLANFLGFYGACAEMGLDPSQTGRFLQGEDTKIMQADRALNELTRSARAAGLAPVFAAHEPSELRAALTAHGGSAAQWLTDLDDFLRVHGWRTEGITDIALPSWIEDPTPVFGMVRSFLEQPEDHDFAAAHEAVILERDAAVDAARSGLTLEEQRVFDAGLASNRAVNFPWWQDEHAFYIDLRVALPMRWASLEIGRKVGADRPDDTMFLFWPELLDVAEGRTTWSSVAGLVGERRDYFRQWNARRPSMPKVLGTVPDEVADPIMIEVFGINGHSLKVMQRGVDADATELTGIAAAKGTARGTARVLSSSDELHRLSPGDILVCESTSPNWTPAFGKIAACVCDGGGTLSHAAIVGREYGIPTVTAAAIATATIRDGDEIEVDGNRGIVTILKRADQTASATGPSSGDLSES